MMLPLVVFVGFLAVALGGYYLFVLRPEDRDQRQLNKRLKESQLTRKRASLVKEIEAAAQAGTVDTMLSRLTRLAAPLRLTIDQSGLRLSLSGLLLMTALAAAVPFLLVYLKTGRLFFAIVAGGCASVVPLWWVRRARAKRLLKFEEQFPEGIDLISRALRAGHTFQTGLVMVSEEMEAPMGTEFRLLYDRQTFGMPLAEAIKAFADRTPLLDAKFFATAVLTQREVGGNLAEVLDNLAAVIRERFKVKRQVRVISAHGRITGWILACLPPALAAIFMFVSPQQITTLVNSPLGIKMIYAAILMQITGTLIIRKIVNIEY
jgi:tight adherence protein B